MTGFPAAPGGNAYYYDFLNGIVDEISLWSSIQTESEILNTMYNTPTNNEIGLVGYWDFNEASGNVAYDESGNENNGIITGPTWSDDIAYPSYVLSGNPGMSDGGLHNIVLD